MRIRLTAFCVLTLCPWAVLCPRAHAAAAPVWIEVTTPHFTVISDAGEKQARHVAGQFERMQAVFHKILPAMQSDTGSPIVVLAVKNRRDFQALEPAAYLSKNSLDLAGLFMQSSDRNYILVRLDAEGEHPFSTVYHEYTHYITRYANLPVWLNEGIAEFYQNTDIDAHEIRFGQPSQNDIQLLRSENLLPLPTLFAVDHNSPYYHDEQKGSIFYSEAWALTYMLYFNDFNRKTAVMSNYLKALSAGQTPLAAAVSTFGDLKKLQSALSNEINQSSFHYLSLPMETSVDEGAFKVETLSSADADAYRAAVLVCNDRTDDAQKLIDSVLTANPGSALAHESEGMLHLRRQEIEEARKDYAQAAALHSNSFLAWYYAAVLSMRSGIRENPEIEADLRESLKLNPSFAAADEALSNYYGATDKDLDEALRLSLAAVTAEPDNFSYRLNNANLHMQRKEIPSALAVLEAARPLAQNPGQMAELNSRIDRIKRYQAELEARDTAEAAGPGAVSTVSFSGAAGAGSKSANVAVDEEPHYPEGPPTGPHHTAKGVLHHVRCSYPTVLTFTVDGGAKPVALYANNMYTVSFTAGNFEPKDNTLNPCKLEGMKAVVTYTEVTDSRVAGQILAVEVEK